MSVESSFIKNNNSNESENKFTLRELFFKYASHLPLFLLSLAICLGGAALYLRYVIPVYKAQANMLIRTTEDNNVFSSNGNSDIVSNAVFGGKRINLDNEVERLRSNSFLSRVVMKTGYNISYYDVGNIKNMNIYADCPFVFYPYSVSDSSRSYQLYFKQINNAGGFISFNNQKEVGKDDIKFKWDDSLNVGGIKFFAFKRYKTIDSNRKIYSVSWKPVFQASNALRNALLISPLNAKATIIQLSIKSENPRQAKDLLNSLISEYSLMNIEDKNKIARSTIRFVDERLQVVTDELAKVTQEIQKYKEDNQVLDIQKQFQFYLDNSFENVKEVYKLEADNNIADLVAEYIQKKEVKDSLVPVSLGLNEIVLNGLIARYNDLQLKKNKELEYSLLPSNPIIIDYENQLKDLRKSILDVLNSVKRNNLKKVETLKSRNAENKTVLSKIPKEEVDLAEYNRQQNIKQQLYLFLLQKKEETQIASASTVSDYTQLEFAEASNIPIEPNSKNIKLFAIILGLLIPVGIIYVIDLLNDRVITRDDIVRRTSATVSGEISHVDRVISNIVVAQSRNIIAEQFRILRSNLQFLLTDHHKAKAIMVTSSISGEGKSFISLNLASVISLSGKKVALLEFDLRKMRSNVYTGEQQNPKGITNYLIGQTDDLEDIITTVDNFPELHIYRSGPIPPNPAELLMSDKITEFINKLKEKYDYLVIDSAPVGLVSDSFSLVKFTDSVLYVVRQRYTFKRQLEFLNDLITQQKLTNVSLVVNDVHLGGKYGYYGYSYGYGYGYIYRYGVGYRYGYGYGHYGGKYFSKGTDGYFDMPKKKK